MKLLVKTLSEGKSSLTVSRVSDVLGLGITRAYDVRFFLLDTLHQYSKHGATSEKLESQFTSFGCDPTKVKSFVKSIESLDNDTKIVAEILYWTEWITDNRNHIVGLSASVSYEELRIKDAPPNLIPIVTLTIGLKAGDKDTSDTEIYLPITHVGRLVKTLGEIERRVESEVKTLKEKLGGKVLVPGAG
jgi:hypothetical protein